jgi:hypothetical protein
MCEEQQTKIANLIVEAIWRHANKQAEQQSAVPFKEPTTPRSDAPNEATTHSDKEADDES